MHLISLNLFASLALTSANALAAPLEARQDALRPFEVTALVYNQPSGRPGRSPWRRITANVTDPNSYSFTEGNTVGTVPAGSRGVNCLAEWFPGEFTDGRTFSCDETERGYWAIQVFAGSSLDEFTGSDFKVKFIHSVEPGQLIASFRARIEGEAQFKSGVNGATTYGCFSSGACNAQLRPEVVPLSVPVTTTK